MWRGRLECQLGKDRERQLLRALHDEQLSEVVCEDGSKSSVESGREWRGTNTSSEVCVVAGFNSENTG